MIERIFLISDFLFPIWLVVLIVILKRRGISIWKAWGIASTFCLVQAYVVAKIIGWNLGGYLIILVSSLPSIVFGKEVISDAVTERLTWIIPPLVFIIIPMTILFLKNRYKTTA